MVRIKKCCAPGCNNVRVPTSGLNFHSFPTNQDLKEAWLKAIGKPGMPVKGRAKCICSEHFRAQDYWPTYASGKQILRPNVVPTIFNVGDNSLYRSSSAVDTMGRKCALRMCKSNFCKSPSDVSIMYRIPSGPPELRKVWLDAVGRSDPVPRGAANVCSRHFEPKDFWPKYASGKLSLRPNVVPSRFLDEDLYKPETTALPEESTVPLLTFFKQEDGTYLLPVNEGGTFVGQLFHSSNGEGKQVISRGVNVRSSVFSSDNSIYTSDTRTSSVVNSSISSADEPVFVCLPNRPTGPLKAIDVLKEAISRTFSPQGIDPSVKQEDAISQTKLPDGSVCEFYEEEESTSDDGREESEPMAMATNAVFPQHIGDILRGKDMVFEHSTRKRKASDDPLAQLDGLKSSKIFARKISKEQEMDDTSSSKINIDFEAVDSALGQDSIKFPSSRWSYTRLGLSCIMFLCWDRDLRLIKKAVLQKGSQMSLYLGDQLLADGSTNGLTYDLEGCLRVLDMFEQCKGVNGTNSIWSKRCLKYIFITDGNQVCNACQLEANNVNLVDPAVSQHVSIPTSEREGSETLLISDHEDSRPSLTKSLSAQGTPEHHQNTVDISCIRNKIHMSMNRQDLGIPPAPGKMNEKPLSTRGSGRKSKPSQAPKSQRDTSKVEAATCCPTFDPGRATVGSANVTTNPGYVVVDFVMPGGATPCVLQPEELQKQVLALTQLQSLQSSSEKQRRDGSQVGNRVCWVSDNDKSVKLDLKSPRKRIARTPRAQKPAARKPTAQKPAARKPTARKSTGGPRKFPMSIEIDSETEDPKPLSEVVSPVEDEVNTDDTSESDVEVTRCSENPSTDSPVADAQPPIDSPFPGAQPPADSPVADAQPTDSPASNAQPSTDLQVPDSQPPDDSPKLDLQPPSDSRELEAQSPTESPVLEAHPGPVITLVETLCMKKKYPS